MTAPNITRLGLLFETEIDVASVREQPRYVSFPHKLMHEFAAALFIAKTLQEAQNMKVNSTPFCLKCDFADCVECLLDLYDCFSIQGHILNI